MTEPSSSSTSSSSLPYTDDRKEEFRKRYRLIAEDALSYKFHTIFQRHLRQTADRAREAANDVEDDENYLTDREQQALDLSNYRSYFLGVCAGGITFGTIMGFGLWRKQRLLQTMPIVPQKPKSSYSNLDRIAGKRKNPSTTKTAKATKNVVGSKAASATRGGKIRKNLPNTTKTQEEATETQVVTYEGPTWSAVTNHLEMVLAMGLSLVVGVASSFYMDDKRMYRDFGRLPLEPGKSYLCKSACPELLKNYRDLILLPHEPTYSWQDPITEYDIDAGSYNEVLAEEHQKMREDLQEVPPDILASDQELWAFPHTRKLEAMVRFVTNCEQRQQYELEIKRNQVFAMELDQLGGPAEVPEPGVPETYLGIVVREEEDEAEAEVDSDDIPAAGESEAMTQKPWWKFW